MGNSNSIVGIDGYYGGSSLDMSSTIASVVTMLCVITATGYGIYLIILGFKHGADKVLASLQSVRKTIRQSVSSLYRRIASWRVFHVFARPVYNWVLWIVIVGVYLLGSSILSGNSSLLKIDRIPEGMVGIDLRNEKVIEP